MTDTTFANNDDELIIARVAVKSKRLFIKYKINNKILFYKEFNGINAIKVIYNFLGKFLIDGELLQRYEMDITRMAFEICNHDEIRI